jgi:hypothetical protein
MSRLEPLWRGSSSSRKKVTKTYIFLCRMGPKLTSKDIEDSLSYPSALGESCECEVVGINFPQI